MPRSNASARCAATRHLGSVRNRREVFAVHPASAKHGAKPRNPEPARAAQVYFYLWKHHLALLHGMVAEYIGRAIAIGMPDQQSRVYEKQLVRLPADV